MVPAVPSIPQSGGGCPCHEGASPLPEFRMHAAAPHPACDRRAIHGRTAGNGRGLAGPDRARKPSTTSPFWCLEGRTCSAASTPSRKDNHSLESGDASATTPARVIDWPLSNADRSDTDRDPITSGHVKADKRAVIGRSRLQATFGWFGATQTTPCRPPPAETGLGGGGVGSSIGLCAGPEFTPFPDWHQVRRVSPGAGVLLSISPTGIA